MIGNEGKVTSGAVDVSDIPGRGGAEEFLRMWNPEEGGAFCFVKPENLKRDPFVFGMLMADAIKHAAWAGRNQSP